MTSKNKVDWVTFLSQAPEYVATALAGELSLPFFPYYPTSIAQVTSNLPAGWVDWEGTLSETPVSDAANEITVPMAVTIVLEATDLAGTAQRQRELMGAIKVWAGKKKSLTIEEVGAVARLSVPEWDWIELSETEGLELIGRVIRVVNVSLGLTVRELR